MILEQPDPGSLPYAILVIFWGGGMGGGVK